ncbi:xanthine dehydrogenase family protein molybdopterin-binding subunit [Egibacter rhizosphaerae]|uniref:Xanthine dehydrogenase family protein molybdopterin-binding subunit n=1 Tax=Egibacter rhizosphaerae TaxID=1670831 RepID=A0A411YHH7_9ACTN|nr:xanthine dehydrogenase family protein molybdopterin-binding subunit [Egibacter rhizosphaerae]QBI20571.1 xanthine dehydrogenase family protein molybdopterin-binding subunit [Egibacter rhizosphaerae]
MESSSSLAGSGNVPGDGRVPGAGAAPRREDARFITGRARYVENLDVPGAGWAQFVRSPVAHARLGEIDTAEAAAMPGVLAVHHAGDLDLPDLPAPDGLTTLDRPVLARDVVRFVGEAVAIVVAESRAAAEDAAELVMVDYEPLESVTDPEDALAEDAPVLFPGHGTNLVVERDDGDEDPLADAELVVEGRFENQRVAAVPLEPNAALVVPEGDGLTAWVSTQVPFRIRDQLADAVGLDREKVAVVAPDVGGGFGAKLLCYPEYVAVAAVARRLGRPVRWVEGRSESMSAMAHGRGHIQHVRVGARRDGTLTGFAIDVVTDAGAYPTLSGLRMPGRSYLMACGPYRVPRVGFRARTVATTTTPIAAYRGAGRPEATALVERAVDLVAAELGLDPAEVRRRNLLPPEAFPHETATGATYDGGDYPGVLEQALHRVDYEALRREQAERRAAGDRALLGIGLSTYVEVTGSVGDEFADVEVTPDEIVVRIGVSPHGQGHETAFAQVVSGLFGVSPGDVRVVHSDTREVGSGKGTMGSRSLQIGGSAAVQSARSVVARARRLVAHLREASVDDVELDGTGGLWVRGSPETRIGWFELAELAADPDRLPAGTEPGLRAAETFTQERPTYPSGTHVAVVEVDADTGFVSLRQFLAADDAGRVLNPLLAEGQRHGGLAQGIAQALFEELPYDEDGNPLAANLINYLVPGAPDLPDFDLLTPETPTDLNPLGARGVGEATTIGSPPAVQNAAVDALAHLGVRHVDLPLTPQRVWRALREATTA